MKKIKQSIYIIPVAAVIVACGIAAPVPTAIISTVVSLTPLTIPTSTETPPPSPTSTPSPIPRASAPDGLHMAYIVDGNLYFQDGNKSPLQLTYSGEDRRPLSFSEDEKKIFFTRGPQEIYSINVDGSQEQALITNDLLLTFGAGYDKSTTPCEDPVLVPHTPFLLFSTCYRPKPNEDKVFNHDLFILNTDTQEIKLLLPQGHGGRFYVSPDGTMLAIDRQNAIDILDVKGKLIHRKIATYPHSEPYVLSSTMYWLPDSSELILALPINKLYDTSVPPTYAIWRYLPDTNTAVQVNLDPPVMSPGPPIWVSPDGNWIAYFNFLEGFFLGNLQDGSTQAYPQAYQSGRPLGWSPDSVHFIYAATDPSGTGIGLYLASINAPPVFIGKGELVGWLDASRYLYIANTYGYAIGKVGKEPISILVGSTQPLIHPDFETLIFNFRP